MRMVEKHIAGERRRGAPQSCGKKRIQCGNDIRPAFREIYDTVRERDEVASEKRDRRPCDVDFCYFLFQQKPPREPGKNRLEFLGKEYNRELVEFNFEEPV